MGKIPNTLLEGNLDFLQHCCFFDEESYFLISQTGLKDKYLQHVLLN